MSNMNNTKKNIIIVLSVVFSIGAVGCSKSVLKSNNDIKENTQKTAKSQKISSENLQISKDYESLFQEFIKVNKENNKKLSDNKIKEIKKFMKIIENLNIKFKENNRNEFCIQSEAKGKVGERKINVSTKLFLKDGNSRYEEKDNNKLAYVSIYNKKYNELYNYDVNKKQGKKITKYSRKHKGDYPYKNGFFLAPIEIGGIIIRGKFQEVDYEGKRALLIIDGSNEVDHKFWIDKETGIIMKKEEIQKEGNKVSGKIVETFTVKENEKFDEKLFKTDEKAIIK